MKKLLILLLALVMLLSLAACGQKTENEDQDEQSAALFPDGKVAIVTNTVSQNEEEYRSADSMVSEFGGRVVHELMPDNFMTEQEQLISVISRAASDPDVHALIINQAVPGVNAAIDKVLEMRDRDDILIIYCTPQENPPDVAARADIIIQPDELFMGYTIVEQCIRMGADTLVHYSFPRHMSQVLLSGRRDILAEECEKAGIKFVNAEAPDPTSDAGISGTQMFILEDVPQKVEQYGQDTAFFSTNCAMQIPLIMACFDAGAMYPQPCCPSPYHGFPSALGISTPSDMVGGMQEVIDETQDKLHEAGLDGRFSTWPVPAAMMATIAGCHYAMAWMDGETDGKLDLDVLTQCMYDYSQMNIELKPYSEDGTTYDNYLLFLMDYLTYGDLPEMTAEQQAALDLIIEDQAAASAN